MRGGGSADVPPLRQSELQTCFDNLEKKKQGKYKHGIERVPRPVRLTLNFSRIRFSFSAAFVSRRSSSTKLVIACRVGLVRSRALLSARERVSEDYLRYYRVNTLSEGNRHRTDADHLWVRTDKLDELLRLHSDVEAAPSAES